MTLPQRKTILLNHKDNVAAALVNLSAHTEVIVDAGEATEPVAINLRDDIPLGHKFAIRKIASGENIIKYGMAIGRATADIFCGAHVSEHNLE